MPSLWTNRICLPGSTTALVGTPISIMSFGSFNAWHFYLLTTLCLICFLRNWSLVFIDWFHISCTLCKMGASSACWASVVWHAAPDIVGIIKSSLMSVFVVLSLISNTRATIWWSDWGGECSLIVLSCLYPVFFFFHIQHWHLWDTMVGMLESDTDPLSILGWGWSWILRLYSYGGWP